MSAFPTLSQKPDSSSFAESRAVDPTIRSNFESGAQHTRPRFTAVPKRWEIVYRDLSAADKASLDTFEHATVQYGATMFTWVNPVNGYTYTVRLGALIRFTVEPENPVTWRAEVVLVEAFPNSGVAP